MMRPVFSLGMVVNLERSALLAVSIHQPPLAQAHGSSSSFVYGWP